MTCMRQNAKNNKGKLLDPEYQKTGQAMISNINFSHQSYLWLLLLLPLVFALSLSAVRHVCRLGTFFFEIEPSTNRVRHTLFLISAIFAFCSLSIALARPETTGLQTEAIQKKVKVAIGIDISKSMLAEDVALSPDNEPTFSAPNRLNLARKLALQLLARMQGENTALFFFAQKGVEMVPLTRDYGFINYLLTYTDITQLALPGTNLVKALQTGSLMLADGDEKMPRILIIISDGEDTENNISQLKNALGALPLKNTRIFCIGTGGKEGALIPIRNGKKIENFYKGPEDEYLLTSLQESSLGLITSLDGAKFYKLDGNNYKDLAIKIYDEILSFAKSRQMDLTSKTTPQKSTDISPAFLISGLIVCTAYFLL